MHGGILPDVEAGQIETEAIDRAAQQPQGDVFAMNPFYDIVVPKLQACVPVHASVPLPFTRPRSV